MPQLAGNDIEAELPRLLAGVSVVALVPATELRGWAAEMAWRVARAAAGEGRRTALVDCFVDGPTLHTIAGSENTEGITDVFEYGASLNRIVQQQPQANLFFVSAGTYAADAQPLVANPRWRRLSAGFRHEEALLLLYVGAEHVATLAAEPDGMIVLSPVGMAQPVAEAPRVAGALAQGVPVLAVIADNEAIRVSGAHRKIDEADVEEAGGAEAAAVPPPPAGSGEAPGPDHAAAPAAETARVEPRRRPSAPMQLLVEHNRRSPVVPVVVVLSLMGAIAWGAWYLLAPEPACAGPACAAADSAAAPPAAEAPVPPVVPLPWAVPVTSRGELAAALAAGDSLEAAGLPSVVAPVRLPGQPPVFRVYAGPFATAAQADSALAPLRAAAGRNAGPGRAVQVPLSLELSGGLTRDGALAERARLRAAGVPTFILGQANGTFRLYAGAYDAAIQAVLLQDILTPTGSAGDMVPRAGYLP